MHRNTIETQKDKKKAKKNGEGGKSVFMGDLSLRYRLRCMAARFHKGAPR